MSEVCSDDVLQGLFPVRVNVGEEVFSSNIRAAVARDNLPWLMPFPVNDKKCVIVAGGPSLGDSEQQIRRFYDGGHTIFAVNNTAAWLIDRGITPHYHVLLDARASNARFIKFHIDTWYLVASQCAPEVFDAIPYGNTILWHPNIEGIQEFIGDRECALIGGGTTVGLQAMSIAYTMGYRQMHLVGFDSCYRNDAGHAYAQPENDGEPTVDVWLNNRKFKCARWMIRQVEEFRGVLRQLVELDCVVTVGGDGYLQEVVRDMMRTTLTAVYDLAVSPPTYDFLSFLSQAERFRRDGNHAHLDIVFMPGPVHGFRDDNLPPDVATRESMLHRVCVAACKLLPSVRNVTVMKERRDLNIGDGEIFPRGWSVLTPAHHYGARYQIHTDSILRATEAARQAVKHNKPYMTITIRQADYWPARNSNIPAWREVERHIKSLGYDVVWIDDTGKTLNVLSWDIDLRLATYEGAVCNLGVSTGPMVLMMFSDCPYLMFKVLAADGPAHTKEFMASHGMNEGGQWGGNGRTVWAEDDAETVIRELDKFLQERCISKVAA